jgi:hypothetical protein
MKGMHRTNADNIAVKNADNIAVKKSFARVTKARYKNEREDNVRSK